jgi:hypothetical protein
MFATVACAENRFTRLKPDSQLSANDEQAKAAPSLAALWPIFATVACAENRFTSLKLDSQLSANDEQAKAAPGRRTPKTAFVSVVRPRCEGVPH